MSMRRHRHEEVHTLRNSRRGNSLRTCAKAIGCSHGIVRKWVSETDVPVSRYGAHVYPEDIREEILKAHREGLSLRNIKRGFGCAPLTVFSWENKNRS